MARKKKISPDDAPKRGRGRPPKPKKRGRKPKPKQKGRPVKKKSVGRPKKKNPVGRPATAKKQVGRPKKRGRPTKELARNRAKQAKLVKKKQFDSQNYNDVKRLLWENFKQDYTSYSEFLKGKRDAIGNPIKGTSIIAEVIKLCPDRRCNKDEVLGFYERVKRYKQGLPESVPPDAGVMPIMPYQFFAWEQNNFWDLHAETELWKAMPDNVWVDATGFLFGETTVFQGILWENYKDGFKPLIHYLNGFQDLPKFKNYQYVANWLLGNLMPDGNISPDPIWNPLTNRWEVKLYLVTQNGDISNFGFDVNVHDFMLPLTDDFEITPLPKKDQPKEEKPTEPAPDDTQKKIDLLKAETEKAKADKERIIAEADAKIKESKANALNAITKAFNDGRITFEQYTDMFNKLSI